MGNSTGRSREFRSRSHGGCPGVGTPTGVPAHGTGARSYGGAGSRRTGSRRAGSRGIGAVILGLLLATGCRNPVLTCGDDELHDCCVTDEQCAAAYSVSIWCVPAEIGPEWPGFCSECEFDLDCDAAETCVHPREHGLVGVGPFCADEWVGFE